MLATRAANGSQIPNPDKFPNGVEEVVAHVHGKGMKMGLYTAAGPHTCAGFAASCDHEEIDARQWADWSMFSILRFATTPPPPSPHPTSI